MCPLGWTWAKNIQDRDRTHKFPIIHIPGSPLCPVQAYQNMCQLTPLDSQQAAFCLISRRGPVLVTYNQYNVKPNEWIQACGYDPDEYSTHNFRRGEAIWAFHAKAPDSLIQLQGDWESGAYKRYFEMGLANKRDVSLKLIKCIKRQSVSLIWSGLTVESFWLSMGVASSSPITGNSKTETERN